MNATGLRQEKGEEDGDEEEEEERCASLTVEIKPGGLVARPVDGLRRGRKGDMDERTGKVDGQAYYLLAGGRRQKGKSRMREGICTTRVLQGVS